MASFFKSSAQLEKLGAQLEKLGAQLEKLGAQMKTLIKGLDNVYEVVSASKDLAIGRSLHVAFMEYDDNDDKIAATSLMLAALRRCEMELKWLVEDPSPYLIKNILTVLCRLCDDSSHEPDWVIRRSIVYLLQKMVANFVDPSTNLYTIDMILTDIASTAAQRGDTCVYITAINILIEILNESRPYLALILRCPQGLSEKEKKMWLAYAKAIRSLQNTYDHYSDYVRDSSRLSEVDKKNLLAYHQLVIQRCMATTDENQASIKKQIAALGLKVWSPYSDYFMCSSELFLRNFSDGNVSELSTKVIAVLSGIPTNDPGFEAFCNGWW